MKRITTYLTLALTLFLMGTIFGNTVVDALNSHITTIAEASNDRDKNEKKNKNNKKNNQHKKNNNNKNHNRPHNPPKNHKPVVRHEPRKPEHKLIVVEPQPQQPPVIENNNNIENNVENVQHVVVERPEVEEKIVYVTEEGSPVYETEEIVVTPETGTGLFSLLALVPGSVAGYFLRRRALA